MKILITGSTGMVGVNLCQQLNMDTKYKLLTPSRKELNLLDRQAVYSYIKKSMPDLIIHLAAKVGGIQANINAPVEFLVENTLVNTHVIHSALQVGVPKLINLGSSCMYPRDREILCEDDLLTGKLEPTNEGYAIAKVSTTLLCEYICKQHGLLYKTIVPANLYGPYDNFDPIASHLIPAIIRKLHEAKINQNSQVEIWGDGQARREFMYVDDLIEFIKRAIDDIEKLPETINVGLGYDYTIDEYYKIAAKVIGYNGSFAHDTTKPAGMQRKLLDITKAKQIGWQAKISLEDGLSKTYKYFLSTV